MYCYLQQRTKTLEGVTMTTVHDFEPYIFQDVPRTNKNVLEGFDGMSTHDIKGYVEDRRTQMVNVCMNLTSDFNKASVIRAHSAFLGKELFIVGKRKFDRRGTVGTHHYIDVKHSENLADVVDYLHSMDYTVYAVDNTPECHPTSVYNVDLPEKSAFIYGEEQAGLSEESVTLCDASIYIPQPSPVPRSLNVSQAAAIMMSEYSRRHTAV